MRAGAASFVAGATALAAALLVVIGGRLYPPLAALFVVIGGRLPLSSWYPFVTCAVVGCSSISANKDLHVVFDYA